MATPTPGTAGRFSRRNVIIAVLVVAAIIGAIFLLRGRGKKTEEGPEKGKGPSVLVTMTEPVDGSTVPEINTLKFTFTKSVKTDKVKVKITDPKGKSLEGSRSGFDEKSLHWVLLKRSIEPGQYKISVESSEKEFETVSFTLTVGPEPTPTPGAGISDQDLEESTKKMEQSTEKAVNAILGK